MWVCVACCRLAEQKAYHRGPEDAEADAGDASSGAPSCASTMSVACMRDLQRQRWPTVKRRLQKAEKKAQGHWDFAGDSSDPLLHLRLKLALTAQIERDGV